jgi:tetratricopeptide (TPR) repeat protein
MELLTGVTAEEVCTALRGRDPSTLDVEALRALVRKGSPQDDTGEAFRGTWWQTCTRIAHQVALGMRHAHLRGIVHRDLKPSNVMLTPHGQAIVLDFGVAQMGTARELTRSGATPGSPAFMSPEQLRGEATDERTDVYSLGATLWQMLALQRPFPDHKLQEHVQQGHLPSLRARNRLVPRELELVLRTAMDRDRERRYGDMGAFANDLLAVLARKPIAARPLGRGLRVLRWCQRHRVTATALAAVGVGAAVLPVALAWQQAAANAALRAEQQRTRLSLETSLDALHSVLVRLGNDRLRNVPLAEQVAHAALTDAADLYRKLLEHHPDHERVRVQAGRALHALSMSFERQGKVQEALATVREAIEVLDGDALDRSPSMLDIRAHARMSLASALADLDDAAAAHAAIDTAERDFLAAARTPACVPAALRGRANLRTTRSVLLDERTEPARAEAVLREAVQLHGEAMAMGPDRKDPMLRITYLANLAKFLARQERDEEARRTFEQALRHAGELEDRPGAWPPPAVVLAELEEGIGNLLARKGDPEAETHLRACLASRERALAQFPDNLVFKVQLGGTLHNLGTFLLRQENRPAEAIAWFERARACQMEALAKAPTHRQSRVFLANHLRMLGACQASLRRGGDLLQTARALAKLDLHRDSAYAAARFYLEADALLGEGARTAPAGHSDGAGAAAPGAATSPAAGADAGSLPELALQQLLAAERHGFDAAGGLDDPLFAPLHERPEFIALRERLGAKAAAK